MVPDRLISHPRTSINSPGLGLRSDCQRRVSASSRRRWPSDHDCSVYVNIGELFREADGAEATLAAAKPSVQAKSRKPTALSNVLRDSAGRRPSRCREAIRLKPNLSPHEPRSRFASHGEG